VEVRFWAHASASTSICPCVRLNTLGNMYRVNFHTSTNFIELQKVVAGVTTTLASYAYDWSVNPRPFVALTAIGTDLQVEINGVPQAVVSDASHASGAFGLVCGANVPVSPTQSASITSFRAYSRIP
jgi:hypothetical protein